MHYSTPDIEVGRDVERTNIFGAPCDVYTPFTRKELHQNYLGCQNLPTAMWVARVRSATQQTEVPTSEKDMENRPFYTQPTAEAPATLFRRHGGL